ncbi:MULTISPECIES: 2-amino-4-oxopentanoate thiolase subunit OrtB [Terrisporobacter]|uniref:2-amino-4-oxopentanoate thiolase subunit OrtB n=1 Tax=Terrisporobacter muris TaxID=2963284 RepID=A0A9X2M8H5_9FIRM|nr:MULTISPECIES: 2-amino-4-oxopentanoate thiolase subunit OrtB [Terrisporobacter]MCC3670138.1 PLP-dependent lyase/thiolase [Terrisporobacter mayombei]MCR1821900.1 2-amino-4-oxopentanoate thiolase subunit OrtB [Terrisporobacter muris]MDU6983289.1 2-amino-4-oxopentanoate thiolase subunit OrtB [Terrisporobacter othiniensis]
MSSSVLQKDMSYEAVMGRKNEIMKNAIGLDYSTFEENGIGFDYEKMMSETGYTLEEIESIQSQYAVGNTPIIELKNLTKLARKCAPKGKGARIFIKDEAMNASGSFKARRAATAVYHAKKMGYKGVIAATSGNYGAAVASQAAMQGLKCIIVQECYDSKGIGQPEIIEKARKCEAYGAEVVQLTVGPELFYTFLALLEETGYFNASLYSPFGIAGVETLGDELSTQFKQKYGKNPDVVVCTNAGGGNLTGTARGLIKADALNTQVVGASVDLKGLHMASDSQFNRKSFTTGHTGFGIPFCTWPDRSDVPRSAARPLRYMDRYVLVKQGEVFYITELLAQLEGIERGPAGNTSLTAAFSLAQELDEDKIIVVQETEYTGAGKHINPQLTFARENGIEIKFGNPKDEIAGENLILPQSPELLKCVDVDMNKIRRSYIKNCVLNNKIDDVDNLSNEDIEFLMKETKTSREFVIEVLDNLK